MINIFPSPKLTSGVPEPFDMWDKSLKIVS